MSTKTTQLVHAGALSLFAAQRWCGVLISGASGAGKSDLALRGLAAGFSLVADDYSDVFLSWDEGRPRLYAAPPETLKGRMEVRGLGIVSRPYRPLTVIELIIHLQDDPPERLPGAEVIPVLGINVPALKLRPFEASAVAKMLVALQQCAGL